MKIKFPVRLFRIDGKQRRFLNLEMDSVAALRHMTAGMTLIAQNDREQKNGPAVRKSHLSGVEHLIRRPEWKLLRGKQRIARITLQHRFESDLPHRTPPSS